MIGNDFVSIVNFWMAVLVTWKNDQVRLETIERLFEELDTGYIFLR